MGTRRATFAHPAGLESALPTARDRLGWGRPVPGEIVAATYPFGAPTLCMDDGVWYGRVTQNNTPLVVDPYAFTNSNSVVIGSSGSGKSAWTKVHLLRVGELGAQRIVIDPGESGGTAPSAPPSGGRWCASRPARATASTRSTSHGSGGVAMAMTAMTTMGARTTRCASM